MNFSNYQPFVCPCNVYCGGEHKQINLYLDKTFYGKSLYATVNQKELENFYIVFVTKTKKNVVFVTNKIIAFISKN